MKKIILSSVLVTFTLLLFGQCPPPDPDFSTTSFCVTNSGGGVSQNSSCINFGTGGSGCFVARGDAATRISSFSCGFCYDFNVTFDISGDGTAPQTADGFTFSLMEMGTSGKGCADGCDWSPGCPTGGGNIGYITRFEASQPTNNQDMFVIEIDLHGGNTGDPASCDEHITMNTLVGDVYGTAQNTCIQTLNLEDGNPHNIQICWDPVNDRVTVAIDGTVRATYNINLETFYDNPNSCGGGSNVFPVFTSGWEAGNAASICGITVLNENKLNFLASLNSTKIELTWENLQQDANAIYYIERSPNGKDFNHLATIESKDGIIKYKYEDFEPINGSNYYRLKEKKIFNNTETTSPTKVVNFNQNTVFDINQVGNAVLVNVKSKASKKYMLKIFDINGKIIADETHFESSETQLKNLSTGIYIVNLISEGENITKKIILTND